MVDKRSDSQVGPPSWTPTPMLDGAPLPANASIRDCQQRKAGYVANAMEQALLLSKDMANLRSMRRHEFFLSLKREFAKISPSISSLFFFFKCCNLPPLSSFYCFTYFFIMFLSSAGHSIHNYGRRDSKFLPSANERRRRRKVHCSCGGLQCG